MKLLLTFLFLSPSFARLYDWTKEVNLFPTQRFDQNVSQLCSGDSIRFSAALPTTVKVQRSLSFGTIHLPNNGELILADNIQIGGNAGDLCTDSRSLSFSAEPDQWYDLDSWKIGSGSEMALDEQLVPCQDDETHFPPQSTFMAQTPIQLDATLNSMQIWGTTINSQASYNDYVTTSPSGKYQFSNFKALWQNQDCDSTGCTCRPRGSTKEAQKYICKQIKCGADLGCKEAFTPAGQCCPLCGAVLKIAFDQSFNFVSLDELVKNEVQADYPGTTLDFEVSKHHVFDSEIRSISDTFIQVLLVDSDGSGKAAKNEANILAKKLSGFPGIETIDVINSGGTGSMSGGAIFGIIFAVMVALGLAGFAYKKRDQINVGTTSYYNTNYSNPPTQSAGISLGDVSKTPKEAKRRAPPPKSTQQTSQVDAMFGDKDGIINVNYDSASLTDSDTVQEHSSETQVNVIHEQKEILNENFTDSREQEPPNLI